VTWPRKEWGCQLCNQRRGAGKKRFFHGRSFRYDRPKRFGVSGGEEEEGKMAVLEKKKKDATVALLVPGRGVVFGLEGEGWGRGRSPFANEECPFFGSAVFEGRRRKFSGCDEE